VHHDEIKKPVVQLGTLDERSLAMLAGVQHIGFRIATEEFLLEAINVKEIIMLPRINFIPFAHEGVEGVIALRGEIMPLLNLRRMLGFSRGESTQNTRVIVVLNGEILFGLIVDEITEFVSIEESNLEAVPSGLFDVEHQILSGVGKVNEKVRGIVSVEFVLRILQAKQDVLENFHLKQKNVS
jgi:purine-binding chemotaxis protein CheW